MYVAFSFMIFFCIRICIHDLHLHLHSHVCCIGIHVHDFHLWSACARMFINHVSIYAYVHAYLYIYVCNNTSDKDLICMHQTTLDHFLGNISHMHMHICNGYDEEKVGGKYSLHVPMTHHSLTKKVCMNGLGN